MELLEGFKWGEGVAFDFYLERGPWLLYGEWIVRGQQSGM